MPLRLVTILALLAGLGFASGPQGATLPIEVLPEPMAPGQDGGVTAKLDRDIEFLGRRIAADPFDWISRNSLGAALYSRARVTGDEAGLEQAAHVLQDSLLHRPRHNPDALAWLALVTMASHSFVEARKLAEIGLADEPDNAWLLAVRGDAHFGHGDYEMARVDYERVNALRPGFATKARLGAIAFVFGDAAGAMKLYEEAAEDAAELGGEQAAWARMMVGMQCLKRRQWRLARHHFILCLRIAPDYRPAMGTLAQTLEAEGRDSDARPYLQVALSARREPRLALRLAALEQRAGNLALAASLGRQVKLELSMRAGARQELGDRRLQAEALMDANIDLDRALNLARQDLECRRDLESCRVLCRALRLNAFSPQAVPVAREMLRLDTPDAALWQEAILVFRCAGLHDDARDLHNRALRLGLNLE